MNKPHLVNFKKELLVNFEMAFATNPTQQEESWQTVHDRRKP